MNFLSFFAGLMTGCFIITWTFGVVLWMINRPVDQMVVEKGLDKHLEVDRVLSFGELYFLLELSPKDIRVLHNALNEYIMQGIAEGGYKTGYKLVTEL